MKYSKSLSCDRSGQPLQRKSRKECYLLQVYLSHNQRQTNDEWIQKYEKNFGNLKHAQGRSSLPPLMKRVRQQSKRLWKPFGFGFSLQCRYRLITELNSLTPTVPTVQLEIWPQRPPSPHVRGVAHHGSGLSVGGEPPWEHAGGWHKSRGVAFPAGRVWLWSLLGCLIRGIYGGSGEAKVSLLRKPLQLQCNIAPFSKAAKS